MRFRGRGVVDRSFDGRRAATVVALVLITLGASSCITSRSAIPGVLRDDVRSEQVEVVGTYDQEVGHFFLLWGLAPQAPEDLFASDLKRAVKDAGADGAANIRLESFYTPGDVFLNAISIGFFVPRTYRMRADLVRINAPIVPGRALLGRGEAPR